MCYLVEYPWASEGGSTYHHGIHTIAFKALASTLCRGDVSISYDGDVHAGILLDSSNESPVGFASVHLGTCSAMQGKRLNATILKSFCQIHDKRCSGG